MGRIDIGSKKIINLYNQAWIEWTLQQPVQIESELSGEFQFVMRDSDSLIKVKGPDGSSFLSLTELQFRYDDRMPERIAAYAALAREKYHLKVFVTVIYFLPPKDKVISNVFHQELMGQTVHQDFQVISLWELDAKQALAFNNPAVLPFIPLMNGGDTVEILRTCVGRVKIEKYAAELKELLAVLASYVIDKQLVNQITEVGVEIIEESPLFQWFLEIKSEEYREEGRKVGRKEGRKEGMVNGMLNSLLQLLTFRFEISREYFDSHLQTMELKSIEQLYKTALGVQSLTEFEKAVDAISKTSTTD